MRNNELIVVEQLNPVEIFQDGAMDKVLAEIKEKAMSLVPNVETATGRKEIASMAHKVARSKTLLDGLGKELVSDWKKKAKKVDETRREAREFLDELKREVRKPLTEWEEADAKRIESIRVKIGEIEQMSNVTGLTSTIIRARIDTIENIDITQEEYQELYDDAIQIGTAVLADLNTALEAQLAVEKADAERKAENERLEKIRLEQEAEAERLRKIQEEQEAKARAEREAIEAEKRKIQEEKDRLEAEKRAEQERKDREEFERKAKEEARIKAEQEAKEKAERIERERIESKKRAEEERLRQEALAPDKEKILAWVALFNQDNLPTPNVKSDEAKEIVAEAENAIIEALQTAEDEAKAL